MPIEKSHTPAAAPKPLENRTFGLIFAGIFLVITLFPLLSGNAPRMWSLYVSGGFSALAILLPVALTPLNFAFQKFGMLMHKITNPILMGLVFFLTVLPTGLVLKVLGKDPMRRKLDANAETYWIKREQHLINKESFDNQF
ncbi:hypothetical protein GCM10008090_26780 [Arenicella chitinivorans]|uniref:SxtJ n=1 Tax=Arenicella chitinivorans TaxID=1329800 RepID=A0A918RYN4_9GAMM|nr:SxtJ family membrane protein [Arenicella chitinivorans]GHA15816.1 hypothetical protein GCM10008090_26780 [Arenicella chitinivorans]